MHLGGSQVSVRRHHGHRSKVLVAQESSWTAGQSQQGPVTVGKGQQAREDRVCQHDNELQCWPRMQPRPPPLLPPAPLRCLSPVPQLGGGIRGI